MKRQHCVALAAVIAIGALLRVVSFPYVGIWLDHGFYSYDSRLILERKTPFVDFLGRSPLFLYALAGWRALWGGYSPAMIRSFIGVLWLATTLPVYGLARRIDGHRGALVAAAAFAWLPYCIVYGQWANTMALAALFGTTAIYVLVVRDRAWWWAAAGILLGGAFLSRRSVIVLGAVCLALALRDWRVGDAAVRQAVGRLTALTGAGLLTLIVGYAAVMGGDLSRTWALFETHAINLVISTGRGGWPMINSDVPTPSRDLTMGRIPIFNSICQLCGEWTARTLAKGLLTTIPASAIVIATGLRYTTSRWFTDDDVLYLFAPLGVLAGYAALISLLAGYYVRLVALVTITLCVVAAYRSSVPALHFNERPALLAVLTAIGAFAAGYLYRERVLHVYYGMDIWPYLSVLGGLGAVALWRRADRFGQALLAAGIALTIITSGAAAYPLGNIVMHDNSAGWFTPGSVQEYSADIANRTEPGDVVLAQTAIYVAGTEADMVRDDSRATAHMFSSFGHGGPMNETYRALIQGMRTGQVELIVRDAIVTDILVANRTVARLYRSNYCRVRGADALYNRTNATLYEYQPTCSTTPELPQNTSIS